MSKSTYIPPRATSRLPRLEDVNHVECNCMLGGLMMGLVMAVVTGVIVWAVMHR